ncbi:MAG: efflux transporter periplasmic adaptor subunit [Curvibacter sp. RIFCSPHIGHO2_12_FULL_63_18]|uniref:efflux RND transporter periplasmic adaptor subunit n=1 Tax=Rhodoferax sp. TaxID=50421 RepID=UPI0008CAE4D2|nr:efflux RND transporter periplasmic adaptor subunit [Rhodoferax sp.]OGO94914.1 MAG: efflux transporter periplasmic adaptor subunit [Curvibacter sp. GWA2_63_95]OGP01356.1 MAG: efflux transporter periplasmic adaptor subunit [Curvibacter sp. RIFCSPHIGHO2_12_FULL_63_18]HCX82234.1 efflux RND transporter periplasmic adaptor subunit [Rhodoferax sp.]
MSTRTFYTAGAVLAAALLATACSKPAPSEEPVRAVKVSTVGASSIQSGSEFSGEVRPRIESRLGFRVAGKLVRRPVELGQMVKAGQVLAQLDPQDYKLATEAARAQVAAAATNRDLAAADFKRFKELRDQNFISGAELERREATLKAAQAQLDQAQAQLNSQGNQASYTTLVADMAGVVTAINAEPGQVVSAGTPVVQIAQDGPRDVVFSVPEDKVVMIKAGSAVDVKVWASKTTVKGVVREVAASADPVTRTFVVKVALDAKDSLALGTTVSVVPQAFDRSGVQVIKLPTSALVQSGKSTAVWVLDSASMTVKLQPITVATADGNEAVVADGLQPGMQVVIAGVHVLSPGQKVSIYKEKMPLAPVGAAQAAPEIVAPAVAKATSDTAAK